MLSASSRSLTCTSWRFSANLLAQSAHRLQLQQRYYSLAPFNKSSDNEAKVKVPVGLGGAVSLTYNASKDTASLILAEQCI